MSIQDGSFDFQLTKPLKYSGTQEATFVKLQEPGMEHIKHYSKLKQMMTRAQMELARKASDLQDIQSNVGEIVESFDKQAEQIESEFDQNYQGIKLMIESAESVDFSEFVGTFEKMVCVSTPRKAICLVDGKITMNDVLWKNLRPDDAIEMALRWCAFFGMPSQEGEKTSSEPPSTSAPQPMEV
jgi:hypothetical protein